MSESEAPVADLHVHTTASDGTLTVADLPAAAADAGLSCVAVTDHDRIHPALSTPLVRRDGVTLVRGIELRVDAGEQALDLLGYAVRHTDALDAEVDRLQKNRRTRAREIVDRVEAELGVSLDLEVHEGVGRPHVARAIAASDAPYDYQGAFDHLIGDDGPCYVARELPTVEQGLALLSEACPVVGLAHPFRYDDVDAALALAPALDAVERYYPYGHAVDTDRLDRLVAEHDLVATGGSDAHGTTLGKAGLPQSSFERFADCVPGVTTDGRK